MKTAVLSTAVLLIAGAAAAQTTPAAPPQTPPAERPGSNLTRDLNSGPPAPATYLAPAPAPVTAAPVQTPAPATPAPARPAPVQPRIGDAVPVPEGLPAPRTATPIPTTPAPQPRTQPLTPDNAPRGRVQPLAPDGSPRTTTPPPAASIPAPRTTPPSATPTPAPRTTPPPASTAAPAVAVPTPAPVAAPPPPPATPTVTVLDASARAALPFSVDLPRGFEIVTGRPGPNFRIYTIRRGERSFVMVYAGPNSQFPIYSGDMVEVGGRASVVSTEDGQRHAMEHLFRRATDPLEVHVWTMTLDGADRALAEQIAQSVDAR